MSESVLVVWDDHMASYDFGPQHPLRPVRLRLTMNLAQQLGVLRQRNVEIVAPKSADDSILQLVHDRDYIGAVRTAPDELMRQRLFRYGLGGSDNPIFVHMHEAAALVTGASVDAADAVWTGRAQHAVNLSGGLHHALRDRASGFCVYDDPAIAIAWLLAQGAQRVAYVDIDVHHGDGVQIAFYDDPRVLTVSLHQSGATLFPGTGFPEEVGEGAGRGTSINVALPPGTADAGWLRAIDAVVPPAVRAFQPEILVVQLGCDTHALDPLADLACSVDGHRAAYRMLHELAHEVSGGKWVVLGGGGYEVVQVVPRAWTHALAEVIGVDVAGAETPDDWRADAAYRAGEHAPLTMTDGRSAEFTPWAPGDATELPDPHDPVDRAVAATRRICFPLLDLDP